MIPLFPLSTVLFPGLPLPLHVFEPRYRMLMADLIAGPEPWTLGIVAIRAGHEVGADSVKSLYDVGCTAVIQQVEQLPDGRLAVLLVGQRRFRLRALDESRPYLQADVASIDETPSAIVSDDLLRTVRERFRDYCFGLGASHLAATLPDSPADLSHLVAATVIIALDERQALLETPETEQRLRVEADLLSREIVLLRAGTMPMAQPRLPPHSQN